MIHRADFYTSTVTKVGGAIEKTYSLAHEEVPCMVQPALSELIEEYGRRDEIISHSIFLIVKPPFDAIGVEDRIVYDSVNYEIVGKKNLINLNRVFRIDVKEAIQ